MDADERFELHAHWFLLDTGMMAPGKDQPVAGGCTATVAERYAAWRLWFAGFRRGLRAGHTGEDK